MIYSQQENPKCQICAHAVFHETNANMVCKFKGTMPEDFCCRKFKYDIFKREIKPHKKIIENKFTADDFKL